MLQAAQHREWPKQQHTSRSHTPSQRGTWWRNRKSKIVRDVLCCAVSCAVLCCFSHLHWQAMSLTVTSQSEFHALRAARYLCLHNQSLELFTLLRCAVPWWWYTSGLIGHSSVRT